MSRANALTTSLMGDLGASLLRTSGARALREEISHFDDDTGSNGLIPVDNLTRADAQRHAAAGALDVGDRRVLASASPKSEDWMTARSRAWSACLCVAHESQCELRARDARPVVADANQLSPSRRRHRAGAVIERPASVIKEWSERARGARPDSIDVRDGESSIRVSDDGRASGSELALASVRHTTSKLTKLATCRHPVVRISGGGAPSIAGRRRRVLQRRRDAAHPRG